MLVLSRKIGEEIVIGKGVHVRVLRVSGSRAFLAIEAPAEVVVVREELWRGKNGQALTAERRGTAGTRGGEEAMHDTLNHAAGGGVAPILAAPARLATPMQNRAAEENCVKQGAAGCEDFRRILQLGIPLGTQPQAAQLHATLARQLAAGQAGDRPTIEFYNDLPANSLRAELQSAALAIVLELLHNARRHSQSQNILLGITVDEEKLCVQVQDWGVGFHPHGHPLPGRGLQGIRHLVEWLGGILDVDSHPGKGTCVVVELPLVR